MNTFLVPRRRSARAFTLIELLTVMAIIVILAGLILGVAGSAQGKAARGRAEAEIKGLEAAINSYEVDNGTVPQNEDTNSDGADPRKSAAGSGFPDAKYQASSLYLFKALSGYYDVAVSTNAVVVAKTYFPFKSSQISPTTAANANGTIKPLSVRYIVDPFGQSYGYSTAALKEAQDKTSKGDTTATQTKGFNPTFDLWSTVGYGTGKKYPTNLPSAERPNLWINNWSTR